MMTFFINDEFVLESTYMIAFLRHPLVWFECANLVCTNLPERTILPTKSYTFKIHMFLKYAIVIYIVEIEGIFYILIIN